MKTLRCLWPLLIFPPVGQGGEPKPVPKTPPPVAGAVTYAVVVHAKNPLTETDAGKLRRMVKDLFLKNLAQWPDGVECKPYDREVASPEHHAFLKEVLGMSEAELARHWLRQKNQSGTTPPKAVDNDRLVLRFVGKHEGALGIVRADLAKADGVKVLFEFHAKP